MKKLKLLILLLSLTSLGGVAQDNSEFKIYDETNDSIWLPAKIVISGTFDVLQNPYWFNQKHFRKKSAELWKRIKTPDQNIKKDGGYSKFFKDEFLSSRVLPNIGLHFLGGAYDTLWLTEYYTANNYPYPRLWAFLTTYATHFGNEALETSGTEISSHDHIADLYFFDLAAFFFASYENGMNYLINDLGMTAWHFEPMFDLDGSDFFNTGLNYVFRPKMAYFQEGKFKPLFFLGMQVMGGISYQVNQKNTFSFASGMNITDPLKQKGRLVSALFYETNNQLDASLFINGSEDFRWRLNLYDNLSKRIRYIPESWRLHFMLGQKRATAYMFGINLNMPFGLGGIKNTPREYFLN